MTDALDLDHLEDLAPIVTVAMRAFEPLSSVLRYREAEKWHTCDIAAMREALKAAFPALCALVRKLKQENALLHAAGGATARRRRRIMRAHGYDEDKALTAIRSNYEASRALVRKLEGDLQTESDCRVSAEEMLLEATARADALEAERDAERERCADAAYKAINVFQDIAGWRHGENRNKLVCDICEKAVAAIRKGEPG